MGMIMIITQGGREMVVTRRHYARFTGAMNSLKFVPYVVPLLKRVN